MCRLWAPLLGAALLCCAPPARGSTAPAPAPGLLSRTLDLLGWGAPAGADSELRHNVTDSIQLFRSRVQDSAVQRLKAIRSVYSGADRWQQEEQDARAARVKRDHPVKLPLTRDEKGVGFLNGSSAVEQVWQIPAVSAQHVHVFSDQDRTYALAAFGDNSTVSWLYELQDGAWNARYNFSSFGTRRFTSFVRDQTSYVIGAEFDCVRNRKDKRGPILYEFRGGQIRYQHALPILYPADVAIWEDYDTFHIGVASELAVAPDGKVNYHVNSSIFAWTDGNFRESSFPTFGARDIEHFQIQNHFFVAVANHRNNDGSLNVHSEIRRYSLATGRYQSFQRLLTRGAVRFRHFSWGTGIGAEHFLAVANQADKDAGDALPNYRVDSVIYKFSGNQFVPFQCIPTHRAQDLLPVWGLDGEFVLAVLDDEALKLYQYTGWRFVLSLSVPEVSAVGATVGLGSFRLDNVSHLTVGSTRAGPPAVYRLHFTRRADLRRFHAACRAWCAELAARLAALAPNLTQLRTQLGRAPKLTGTVRFRSLRVRSQTRLFFRRTIVNTVLLADNVTLNAGLLERIEQLRGRLQENVARLHQIQTLLPSVVRTDQPHSFNTGVRFTGVWTVAGPTSLVDVRTQALNGIAQLPLFLTRVVWTDREVRLTASDLHLTSVHLPVQASLVVSSVDQLDTSRFVTLTGRHVISASKVVRGHVSAGSALVHDLINGLKVLPDTVLVHNRLPAGVTRFSDVTVADLRTEVIGGIDVGRLLQRYVPLSSKHLPAVVFSGPAVIRAVSASRLNGVSLERLFQRGFTTDAGQTITGRWEVDVLHVHGQLHVQGRLNGVHVPADLVLIGRADLTYQLQNLTVADVTVQQLTALTQLGPINVSPSGDLSVLLTSGAQTVSGRKRLGALCPSSDSFVLGTVNGVNITTGLLDRNINQTTAGIHGDKLITGDVTFLGDVTLAGDRRLNGLDVTQVLNSALRLDTSELPELTFTGDLKVPGGLSTRLLNAVSPEGLVLRDLPGQVISASKALGGVSAAAVSTELLNGQLLEELYTGVLTTSGHQTVSSPLLLTADTHLNSVTANAVLWAGHDLDSAVTTRGDHVITGRKVYLSSLHAGSLRVSDLWVAGLIDGTSLTSLLSSSSAAANSTHSAVVGDHSFTGSVTVRSLEVSGRVNSLDLVPLLHAAARRSVAGQLLFTAPVTVDQLKYIGTFDGASSAEFGSGWLTSAGGQLLSGTATVTSSADVTAARLEFAGSGLLNGESGRRLLADRVRIEPGLVVHANVSLAHLMTSSLTVPQASVDLTDVVRHNQTTSVRGQKTFLGGVRVLGSVRLLGELNGLDLASVCRQVVLTTEQNHLRQLTVNGSVGFHRGGVSLLRSRLNGLDLGRLQSLVWLRDADQTLHGHVTLSSRPNLVSLTAQTLLAGRPRVPVDLPKYLLNYWRRDVSQIITGSVSFEDGVTIGRLNVNSLTVGGLVNGRDLTALVTSALTSQGGTVTSLWRLPDLLIIGALRLAAIDGIPVSSLVRRSSSEVHFTAHQTIGQLAVRGDVVLPEGGRLFNLDVSERLNIASYLQRQGSFVVESDVIFDPPTLVITQPLVVTGLVNGVEISRVSLLTLSSDQRLSSLTRIVRPSGRCQPLTDLITPEINGINMIQLVSTALRLNDSAEVTGRWTFIHQPTFLSMDISHGELTARTSQLVELAERALQQLQLLGRQTSELYITPITQIYRSLLDVRAQLRAASYLQYFVLTQRWSTGIIRFVPVYLRPDVAAAAQPTFLLAVWPRRARILSWEAAGRRWVDSHLYPDLDHVQWAAGATATDGSTFVAVARLVAPPAAALNRPPAVYRWNSPDVAQFGDAVNFIYRYYQGHLNQYQVFPGYKTTDVKALSPSPTRVCLLYVHFLGNGSHLLCYRDSEQGFQLHQTLETHGGREASVYRVAEGRVCVAVAGGRLDLWCWDHQLDQLVRRQTIGSAAAAVHSASFHNKLLMAVLLPPTDRLGGLVSVYSYQPEVGVLVHVQTVGVSGVLAARLLVLPSDQLLLLTLSREGQLQYWLYRGAAWFQPRGSFSAPHALTLAAFRLPGLHAQLALAGPDSMDPLTMETHSPAAVYAGKFMGQAW